MVSALWPTDWFRSKGILCTQISLWRLAGHHLDLLKARERETGEEEGKDAYLLLENTGRGEEKDISAKISALGEKGACGLLFFLIPPCLFEISTLYNSSFFFKPASHLLPLPVNKECGPKLSVGGCLKIGWNFAISVRLYWRTSGGTGMEDSNHCGRFKYDCVFYALFWKCVSASRGISWNILLEMI